MKTVYQILNSVLTGDTINVEGYKGSTTKMLNTVINEEGNAIKVNVVNYTPPPTPISEKLTILNITSTYATATASAIGENFVSGDTITITLGTGNTEIFTFADVLPEENPDYYILVGEDYQTSVGNIVASVHNISVIVNCTYELYPNKIIFTAREVGQEGNNIEIVFSNPLIVVSEFSGGYERYIVNMADSNRFAIIGLDADRDIVFIKDDIEDVRMITIKVSQDSVGGHKLNYVNEDIIFEGGVAPLHTADPNSIDMYEVYHEGYESHTNILYIKRIAADLKLPL